MSKTTFKQAGGTLLGLIIGLVIGLGIAVVVAVMITKTPVPFLSKSTQAEKVGALLPGQLTDPNKPMYGNKEAVKDAAKDFAREAPAAAKPADGKPADGKPVDAKAAPPAAAPAPAAPAAAAAVADEKFIYFLQAGAFRDMADAESTRAKLALQGVEAGISERLSDTGTLYRVRVGPFSQLEVMNKIRSKLTDSGVEVAVIRTAK